jgi:hypothetical protein
MRVDGSVGKLVHDLLHFPYRNWQDHLHHVEHYTRLAAEESRKAGKQGNPFRLILAPPVAFLKTLFFKAGFLDGWRGFLIAYMGARYIFIRERRKFD